MSNNSPVIHAAQISKKFGAKTVLQDISLQVPSAQTFGLLGPSGSGKTTLVKILTGIDQATSGSVQVLGMTVPSLPVLRQIGYMAQSDAMYMELSAKENLEFFAALYGLKGHKRRQRIQEVMEIVALEEHLHKKVAAFSGGMKRRLSLAVALLHEPPLLVLDEPTVGIDPLLRQSIWRNLKELNAQGTSILLTTHVMDEAEKCDQLGMIRDGRLLAVGTPANLMNQTGSSTMEEAFLFYGGDRS